MWAALIPAAASMATSLLSSRQKGRAAAGEKEDIEKIIGRGEDFLGKGEAKAERFQAPFRQAGIGALPGLQAAAGQDPAQLINQIISQFRQSPFQRLATQQGIGSIRNLAEAKGLLGTPAELRDIAGFAEKQSFGDQQQFLEDVLQGRGQNLGILQNLYGTGAQTAGQMGQEAVSTAQSRADLLKAQLAAEADADKSDDGGGFLSSLTGGLSGAGVGGILGGKGMLGSKMGAGSGAALGFLKGL
jgi:hypothetical protein